MKKITVKSSNQVRCTSSSVHHETKDEKKEALKKEVSEKENEDDCSSQNES